MHAPEPAKRPQYDVTPRVSNVDDGGGEALADEDSISAHHECGHGETPTPLEFRQLISMSAERLESVWSPRVIVAEREGMSPASFCAPEIPGFLLPSAGLVVGTDREVERLAAWSAELHGGPTWAVTDDRPSGISIPLAVDGGMHGWEGVTVDVGCNLGRRFRDSRHRVQLCLK